MTKRSADRENVPDLWRFRRPPVTLGEKQGGNVSRPVGASAVLSNRQIPSCSLDRLMLDLVRRGEGEE